MGNIIESLWNGDINPGEQCGTDDPEIKNLVRLIERNREVLYMELGCQQLQTLEKLMDAYDKHTECKLLHAFKSGFSLACEIMTEALSNTA